MDGVAIVTQNPVPRAIRFAMISPQAEWHLLDALALRSAGTTF
jgi:hypothetical protein